MFWIAYGPSGAARIRDPPSECGEGSSTAGAAGATVVGALATDAPRPSDDGRTYLFTLRPGVRYSDGTPVRPEDFRASMERFLRVSRGEFGNYYGGIIGADRCMRRPVRCDLSAGIETDASARTIAVHLTRPDEEFLHKLTLPFAYVVPADTPPRTTGERVLPGTGPYRFAGWDDERGGHLIRNPYFRSPSNARPAGYAERIEVSLRDRDKEKEVAEVRRGAADVVALANAFKSPLSPERLEAIEIRSPGQVHSYPEAVLNYMFLNVRRPPFDDVRVRRAINYATDRARILQLEGGSRIASATCQILPSSFPGYAPYCPYTMRPGPGRPWSAPDIEQARALIAESGTRGERVVVTVPEFQRDIGRYFRGLLDRLGYRALLRVLGDSYFRTIYEPGARCKWGSTAGRWTTRAHRHSSSRTSAASSSSPTSATAG